jgi:hypothetical protein
MPIINLNNNRQIIVNENNFPNVMTWKEALSICENNEENWRLPTIVELIELYNQKIIPTQDFGYWSYWSSSKENDLVQILSDQEGNVTLASNNEECYLILVRDI